MDKPIPAFYACYLLRSTVRHSSLYVGSTPNPVRRLKQHNGEAKGGAVRTSRDCLRPWEMACLVTGFPSKIAALQFEWAWQNPHLTRHLLPTARLTTTKSPSKKPSARTRRARPRLTLTDRLANLHLLLRSPSFARWPLTLTFYAADVHKVWERWRKNQPATHSDRTDGLDVRLDTFATPNQPPNPFTDEKELAQPSGIQALDVSYALLRPRLAKSRALLPSASTAHSKPLDCSICHAPLPFSGASTLICPHDTCAATTHIACLAAHFLSNPTPTDQNAASTLVPKTGNCPGCKEELQWVEVVRELSLRMRGEKEIAALFKERRKRKTKGDDKGKDAVLETEESAGGESDEAVGVLEDEDGWHYLSESSEGEVEEVGQGVGRTGFRLPRADQAGTGASNMSEPVVEDSDWDDAEIIV